MQFKYESLDMLCYTCGFLWHTEAYCNKLFSMGTDNGIRGCRPDLHAVIRKTNTNGSGQWLREEGQADWAPPNHSSIRPPNHAQSSQQTNLHCTNKGKEVNEDCIGNKNNMAEIFKNPKLFFKSPTNHVDVEQSPHAEHVEVVMSDADVVVEGHRKHARADLQSSATVVLEARQPQFIVTDSFLMAGPNSRACQGP